MQNRQLKKCFLFHGDISVSNNHLNCTLFLQTLLPPQTPPSVPKTMALVQPPSIIQPPSLSHLSLLKPMRHPTPNLPTHHMRMPPPPPMSQSQPPMTSTPSNIQINITPGGGPIRRRTSEKYGISLGTGITIL